MSNNRWLLIIPLGLSTALSLAGDLTLYATLPVNAELIGLTLVQVGVLLSANRFIRIVSNPLAGILLDKGRRRPIYIYGLVLGTLSTLIYVLSQQFWILLIGRLIWGIAWSFINVGGNTMIVDGTQRTDRGRYLGILRLFYYTGQAINPLIGAFLSDMIGFRLSLSVCAMLSGLGLLLALSLLPETHISENSTAIKEDLDDLIPVKVKEKPDEYKSGKRAPNYMVLKWELNTAIFLFLIINFAGRGLIMSTIGFFLKARYGTELTLYQITLGIATFSGFLLAYRALLIAVIAPIAGGISDRFTSRWSTVTMGLLMGISGMTMLALLQNIFWVLIGISFISISESILVTVLPAIIGDNSVVKKRGISMGNIFVAGEIGGALAPLLVYSLLSVISLNMVYIISAVCFGVGQITFISMNTLSKTRWVSIKK
jgi:MFS family permease